MDIITPNWPAPAQIKAGTTLKHFWQGRYASNTDLTSLLNLPNEPIWLQQKHTTSAVAASPENRDQIADASYTCQANQVCVVLTADCLPVLLCNRQGTEVAAIHAGWRGLAAGIIENTVAQLHSNKADLLVWLGPAIGPTKFEVGEDVYQAFTENSPLAKNAFVLHHPGKWLADLKVLAQIRLNNLEIKQIYTDNFCTYTQEEWFFSYRRDQKNTGRMATFIWIASD